MAREIIVVADKVRVEYDFPTAQYKVYNKDTFTTRSTTQDTLKVLSILVPSHTVTTQQLTTLATTLEPLTSLQYTLADTGEYIRTIQINSYSTYPITIDLAKQKLYVMNSNIVFDLKLNESAEHRVNTIKDYYKRHLGVEISKKDLTIIYDYLTSYNTPHPYNTIPTLTNSNETIKYSSTIDFSNPNSLSPITYSITINPNSLYNTPTKYYIKQINSNKVLELLATPSTLSIGDSIIIDNTTTTISADTSYSSNGTYTITAIDLPNNYIKVKESLAQFSTQYKQAYLKQPIVNVSSVSRSNKAITLTTKAPTSLLIGDTIYLEGTSKTIDFQTISIDSSYTIYSIDTEDNISTITLEETPSTDYTHSSTYATISKHISLGDIVLIKNKVVTTSSTLPTGITGLTVVIDNKPYTIKSATTNTFTVNETITDYTPSYGELKVAEPTGETQVEVLTSNKEELPIGKFLLDTYNETISYLALGTTYTPTLTNFNKASKVLEQEVHLEGCSVNTMHLKGLYKQIYSEK